MRERLAAVASARAAGPRASGVRSHVLARLAAVVMSFVVTMNIGAPVASARVFDNLDNTPVVVWAQYDSGADVEHGFVGNCYNEFTAALTALGYNRSQLTADMETKLSNAGTGGRFYEFSQSLSNGYTDIDSLPGWTPTLIAGYIWSASVIGGNSTWDSLWSWEVSKELFDGAKADLLTVMSGGSLGGGVIEGVSTFEVLPNYSQSSFATYIGGYSNYVDGTGTVMQGYQLLPTPFTVALTDGWLSGAVDAMNARFGSGMFSIDRTAVSVSRADPSYSTITITIFFVPSNTSFDATTIERTIGNLQFSYYSISAGYSYSKSYSVSDYSFSGNVLTASVSTFRAGDVSFTNGVGSSGNYIQYGVYDGEGTGGGGGNNNWPDDDEGGGSDDEPREPEVPDPDPTPVPDPDPIDQPTWPDPDPIDDPVGGGGTTINYSPPTDTTVIENWLAVIYQAIVDGFNSVTDDMATHCNHIQSKLNTVYENLVSMIGKYISAQTDSINNNLSNQVWWLARQIDGQFDELKDYLHDLAEWLAEQLNFEVNVEGNGYDDTSIVSWLKKIYAKLGNGGANSRPVDPVVNDDDWWEWLLRALQNWTAGLILNANDIISNLGDLLSRLISRFPFGIPFMTLDVITLLAADPVTPEFDLSYQVYQTEVSYNVDLEPFNDAAATVRAMEYLIFGGFLLMKTPKVISEMMGVFE